MDVQFERHQIQAFFGPLPPPDVLERYEQLAPGFAERILAMAENEQKHRHQRETEALQQEIANHQARNKEVKRGQWFGFTIGLTALSIGAWLTKSGNPWPGGFIGTGGVIGLVAVFLFSHKQQKTPTSEEP